MRKILILLLLLVASPAMAKPANTECVSADGTRFYMVASKGQVMVQWERGDWNEAFADVEGNMITVTQLAPYGVIVIAWDVKTNSAYVVMKNDKTGKRHETRARCWFK
jgi:opacity protein-like surface antigen